MDILFQFEFGIIHALQNLSPALDGLMNTASFLGKIEFFLILLPFLYWTVDRRIGFRTFLILIHADFVTSFFKLFLHQPRPYWLGGVKELSTEPTYALPSSHASSSMSVGGYFIANLKENWARTLVGIVILLVGISRVYLAVHFIHNILAGWVVGFAVLWASIKWGRQITDWLRSKSLSLQIGLGLIDSLLIILFGLLARFVVSGTPDPASYSSFSADARSVTHFFTLAGALFGTISGYALMRQHARFSTTGTWSSRILRFVIGIISLLILFYGLDTLFGLVAPDQTVLGYILRYIRYGFATFWTIFLVPWLFLKLKLVKPED